MSDAESFELVRRRFETDWQEVMAEVARELVERVDHLPLALELGAMVAKRRGWPFLLGRLREGQVMEMLRRWPEEGRQDSLRLSFDLSYEMLDEKVRRLFVELGRLGSGKVFTLSDIGIDRLEQASEEWEREAALQQLVDAALVPVVDN